MLDQLLPPPILTAAEQITRILDGEIGQPLRLCKTEQQIEETSRRLIPRLVECSLALGLIAIRFLGTERAAHLFSDAFQHGIQSGLEEHLTRTIGVTAAGNVLLAFHTVARQYLKGLRAEPSDKAVMALLMFIASLIAVLDGDRAVAPAALASFGRKQAHEFSAAVAQIGPKSSPPDGATAERDREDVELSAAALRAWLSRSVIASESTSG